MRVAIVSRWNAACGVSLHAELVGRALIEMGHEVLVLAPTLESASRDWHHLPLSTDEDYVVRCYAEEWGGGGWFKCSMLLEWEPDLVVVEGYRGLPTAQMRDTLKRLHERGSTIILVLHAGDADEAFSLLQLPLDYVVVFDHRWVREVLFPYRDQVCGRVRIVPYPCMESLDVGSYRPDWARGRILFYTFGRQPPRSIGTMLRLYVGSPEATT